MRIKDLMRNAIVIEGDIKLKKAAKILSENRISSLIIVSGDKIKGILTEEDLVDNFGKDVFVSKVMEKRVITISENDKVDKAIILLGDNKISVLPVVDKKKNLIGIVSGKELLTKACETSDFLFG